MIFPQIFVESELCFVARRTERQTVFQLAKIHKVQGCFDRNRIDLAEYHVDQWFERDLCFACLLNIAREIIVDHAAVFGWDDIGYG